MNLPRLILVVLTGWLFLAFTQVRAASLKAVYQSISLAESEGRHVDAAKTAFRLSQDLASERPKAFAMVTKNLVLGGFPQVSLYFFLEVLKSNHAEGKKIVLAFTETLLDELGSDSFRGLLLQYTKAADFSPDQVSAYYFLKAKQHLSQGDYRSVLEAVNSIKPQSRTFAFALQLRGTALAILNRAEEAILDFRNCAKYAQASLPLDPHRAQDLQSRCLASEARSLYQLNRTQEADKVYDSIAKERLVWPETLIEQAWNAYSQGEFNRSLGKLITYKSPYLSYILNGEVELLRAMSFLGLCRGSDAVKVVSDFQSRYEKTGAQVKALLESKPVVLSRFYSLGVQALEQPETASDPVVKFISRFVRSPYFKDTVDQTQEVARERARFEEFTRPQGKSGSSGLMGFVPNVYNWRRKQLQDIGGAFIQNSLIDHYSSLVSAFEQMAFVRIEALERTKRVLMSNRQSTPLTLVEQYQKPKSYQYFWKFNGEFWGDELGDYVYAYPGECG